MGSVFFKGLGRFLLLAAFIFAVAGCGSSNSATEGSVAAKLIWPSDSISSPATALGKELYLTPAGVTTVKITVSAPDMTTITKDFPAIPGAAGSGQIDGIPVGTGRTVTAQGLDSTGILRYQGRATVDITAGTTTNPTPVAITMLAPVTTASPAGKSYSSAQSVSVTLTASAPATIYYTTNGADPTTGNGLDPATASPNGANPVINFQVQPGLPVTLKYFAVAQGVYESIKSQVYRVLQTVASPAGGSYSSPQSVTLTASEPATIYYTTNGSTPTTSSANGPSPVSGITVAVNSLLKFFAIDASGTQETIKSESYHNP